MSTPHPWDLNPPPPNEPLPEPVPLAECERQHILYAMRYANGNKSRACRLLGVDRRTLYRKLAAYAAEG